MVGTWNAYRRGITALLVAVLLPALAACGGSGSASTTPTTAAAASSTTTSPTDDGAQVRAAYLAAGRAFIDAGAIPDPDFPALAATRVDPILELTRKVVRSLKLEGRVARYPSPSKYRVEVDQSTINVDGDVATFDACVVDDGQRVEAATGRVIDASVSTVLWKAAMRRVEGTWRLAEQKQLDRWEGEAGCAVG